jgi:hypothetical protein
LPQELYKLPPGQKFSGHVFGLIAFIIVHYAVFTRYSSSRHRTCPSLVPADPDDHVLAMPAISNLKSPNQEYSFRRKRPTDSRNQYFWLFMKVPEYPIIRATISFLEYARITRNAADHRCTPTEHSGTQV